MVCQIDLYTWSTPNELIIGNKILNGQDQIVECRFGSCNLAFLEGFSKVQVLQKQEQSQSHEPFLKTRRHWWTELGFHHAITAGPGAIMTTTSTPTCSTIIWSTSISFGSSDETTIALGNESWQTNARQWTGTSITWHCWNSITITTSLWSQTCGNCASGTWRVTGACGGCCGWCSSSSFLSGTCSFHWCCSHTGYAASCAGCTGRVVSNGWTNQVPH